MEKIQLKKKFCVLKMHFKMFTVFQALFWRWGLLQSQTIFWQLFSYSKRVIHLLPEFQVSCLGYFFYELAEKLKKPAGSSVSYALPLLISSLK
jgi:hypothetical protein